VPDYQPLNPSNTLPYTKTVGATAVVGGTLVSISGDNLVVPSTTGDHPVGVAAHDAGIGGRVTIWPLDGVIHEITMQGVIAAVAGNALIAGTTGFLNTSALGAAAAAGTLIGICTRGGTGGTGTGKAQFIGT
jgi:hypothetical protein